MPPPALVRHARARLSIDVTRQADLVFSVAASTEYGEVNESISLTSDDQEIALEEVVTSSGSRLHRARHTPPGRVQLSYEATIQAAAPASPSPPIDEIIYTRPSRYCDSDRLANLAHTHFAGLEGFELMGAVNQWVRTRVRYTPGDSRVVDGALEVYLSRRGVCRDSAHLVITFLRALNMPARLASVYAPGLTPMDFHAVAEAYWEGRWYLLDATGLAPRPAMARICTGRDASDTAFMTTLAGHTNLVGMQVDAWTEGDLPYDDKFSFVTLN
ncbi:MAG: transglutaminase-like domain-containing protein [Arachnia sp.]